MRDFVKKVEDVTNRKTGEFTDPVGFADVTEAYDAMLSEKRSDIFSDFATFFDNEFRDEEYIMLLISLLPENEREEMAAWWHSYIKE